MARSRRTIKAAETVAIVGAAELVVTDAAEQPVRAMPHTAPHPSPCSTPAAATSDCGTLPRMARRRKRRATAPWWLLAREALTVHHFDAAVHLAPGTRAGHEAVAA